MRLRTRSTPRVSGAMSTASVMPLLSRRRSLTLFAALAAGGRLPAQNADGAALRSELERAYAAWRQAMRTADTAAFAAATSRYRQMCLRNEVISMRQPWPAAVFKSVLKAPDVSRLTFLDATATGDTARAVYFGRVDFALDAGNVAENPVVLRFLREGSVWKFDRIQYVNLGTDDSQRQEARTGGRQLLQGEDFQLTGTYPAVPRACREPYQIAALRILATSCTVTVDVNQGAHLETVENNTGGRIITGGLQKGYNVLAITPAADLTARNPPQLEITVLTRRDASAPAVKLWSWKPAEPPAEWKRKYDASVFVKSKSTL